MPKVYKRHCDYCGKYYEGQGSRFCTTKCANRFSNQKRQGKHEKLLSSICKQCGKTFTYYPSKSSGQFCSPKCYNQSELRSSNCQKGGEVTRKRQQKISDQKLLEMWEKIKSTPELSVHRAFSSLGYINTPPKRLLKLISKDEYNAVLLNKKGEGYHTINQQIRGRGYRAELRATKKLSDDGFYVMRSAGSKTIFDLFAFKGVDVRLIQVKSQIGARKFGLSKLKQELTKFATPSTIKKEIWIWHARKGWETIQILASKINGNLHLDVVKEGDVKK